MSVSDLKQISVTGYQRNLQAGSLGFLGKRSQNIVCLQTLTLHDLDFHRTKDILHHRDLFPKFVRHRFSGPLIRLIHLVTEGGGMHIKGYGQIIRLLLIQDLKQNIQKTIDRICMQSMYIGQIRQSVKSPVQNTVAIDQY